MADTSLEKKRPKSVRGAVFSVQETILRDTKVKLKQNKAQNMYSKNVEMDHTASRSQFTQFLLASHHISFNIRQTKQFLEICKEQAKRSRRPGQPAQEDALSGRGDSWSVWNIPSEGCCQCCRCCQCCTLARLSKATQRHSVQTRFPSKISEFLQHKFGRRFIQDGGTVKLCDDDFIIEFHFLRNGCLVRLCTLMNHPKRGRD